MQIAVSGHGMDFNKTVPRHPSDEMLQNYLAHNTALHSVLQAATTNNR
jgi:hypothetical protein